MSVGPSVTSTAQWAVKLACGIAVVAAIPTTPAGPLVAEKRIRPLTRDAVAQVWAGLSEDELYLFRLDLSHDGTGLGAYVFADEPSQLFRFTWEYDPNRISMTATAVGDSTSTIVKLEGTLTGMAMDLTVSGSGWRRKVSLRPARDLEQRWEKLGAAIRGRAP